MKKEKKFNPILDDKTSKQKKDNLMTLTLRYNEQNNKILRKIMKDLNISTGSGAIYEVCRNYMATKKTIDDLRQENMKLEEKLSGLTYVIVDYLKNQKDQKESITKMQNAIK